MAQNSKPKKQLDQNFLKQLEEILFRHDLMDLAYIDVAGVADNLDEYSLQARGIFMALEEKSVLCDVVQVTKIEFERSFDFDDEDLPDFGPVSAEIWHAWCDYRKTC